MVDAIAVVTTHNALPWIEQCLASVQAVETVVVDNDSNDDTVAFVRERFPDVRIVEQANLGLAAGWARGLETASPSRWALILNADAWLVGDALNRLVAAAMRIRLPPCSARSCSIRTGRCSARCAGFPTRGVSRPSTSTSASSALRPSS